MNINRISIFKMNQSGLLCEIFILIKILYFNRNKHLLIQQLSLLTTYFYYNVW